MTTGTQIRKVLRVTWNPGTDEFGFDFGFDLRALTHRSLCAQKGAKRTFIQSCSLIFDPLGLLAPVVTTVKILFQALWE